jgi:hypothetical protein
MTLPGVPQVAIFETWVPLLPRGEFLIDHRFFHHNIRDRNKLT